LNPAPARRLWYDNELGDPFDAQLRCAVLIQHEMKFKHSSINRAIRYNELRCGYWNCRTSVASKLSNVTGLSFEQSVEKFGMTEGWGRGWIDLSMKQLRSLVICTEAGAGSDRA